MNNVSHGIVGPLAEQVRSGLLDITSFVEELRRNKLIVVSVELSTDPILDHMTRTVEVQPYIVAHIVHEENALSEPVKYALQNPKLIC